MESTNTDSTKALDVPTAHCRAGALLARKVEDLGPAPGVVVHDDRL